MMPLGALLMGMLAPAVAPCVLAVGVNDAHREELPPLRFADDDAAAAAGLFGAPAGRTFLLTTMDDQTQSRHPALRAVARPATRAQLQRAARELAAAVEKAAEAGERPVVLVWLVGHGAFTRQGQPFVALEDAELTQQALSEDVLSRLEAAHRVHVVMDACHSGAMVQWRASVAPVSTDVVKAQAFPAWQQPANVGFITAATGGQKTYEWDEIQGGIFSALTRAALRGVANADGDQCVGYDEVSAYVSSALQGVPVPAARPNVVSVPPRVDRSAPLSCNAWFDPRADLRLGPQVRGAFHVEDARGNWLLGGHLESGHQAQVWLPAEPGATVRTADGEWPLESAAESEVVMPAQPMEVRTASRGAVERAIAEGLFKVPYGPAFLGGYVAHQPAAAAHNAPEAPRREPQRPWWLLGLAAPAVLLGAAAALGVLGGSLVGAWQFTVYASTDLQVPAFRAAAFSAAGMGVAALSLVLVLASALVGAAAVVAWMGLS